MQPTAVSSTTSAPHKDTPPVSRLSLSSTLLLVPDQPGKQSAPLPAAASAQDATSSTHQHPGPAVSALSLEVKAESETTAWSGRSTESVQAELTSPRELSSGMADSAIANKMVENPSAVKFEIFEEFGTNC